MISFFQIRTWHNAHLSVYLKDGQLKQHLQPYDEGYTPIIAFKLSAFPRQLFLTTDHPDKPLIWIDHYGSPRGTIVTVNMQHCGEENAFCSLEDPHILGKFFTTHPLPNGVKVNNIVGDCHHVMAWEQFTLEPIKVSPKLKEEAEHVARLFHYDMTTKDILTFIETYNGTDIQPVLDAVLPFLHWDVLNEVGQAILKNKALVEALHKKSRPNIWLDKVIPDLLEWDAKRSASEHGALLPSQKLLSPVDEVLLAWSGHDSTFSGAFHAFTHTMRRSFKPTRGTCLVSTQRNEGLYLLEWIAYHKMLGIEHFFIYSNNNEDCSDLLLDALSKQGIITWISNEVDEKTSPQFKAYGHAFNALPEILDFEWCFIIDGDEFITLNQDYFHTIKDYFNEVKRKETDAIAVNWRFIGSTLNVNGLVDLALPLTERNSHIVGNGAIGEGWRLVKSICRPQKTLHSRPHHPLWYRSASYSFRLANGDLHEHLNPPPGFPRDPAFADRVCFDKIYISHFYFKSMTEWTWKHARNGGADPTKKMDSSRYNNQWANTFGLQMRDPQSEKNRWIAQRASATREALEKLRAIPGIAEAETQIRKTVESFLYNLHATLDREDLKHKIDPEWHFVLQDFDLEIMGHIPESTK